MALNWTNHHSKLLERECELVLISSFLSLSLSLTIAFLKRTAAVLTSSYLIRHWQKKTKPSPTSIVCRWLIACLHCSICCLASVDDVPFLIVWWEWLAVLSDHWVESNSNSRDNRQLLLLCNSLNSSTVVIEAASLLLPGGTLFTILPNRGMWATVFFLWIDW